MDQPSATTPVAAPAAPEQTAAPSDDAQPSAPNEPRSVGFGSRGRVRRRARFLRKARELAYRDLGGLVYSLHRFGQRNDSLVLAKLATLTRIDAELRGLEASLSERQPVTVLREAGITACPRCAAIHSGEDRFCPNCGLPMSRSVDLPIAGAAATTGAPPTQAMPAAAPPPAPPAPAFSSSATASFAPVPAVPTSASGSAGVAAAGDPAAAHGSPITQAHQATAAAAPGAPVTQAHPVTPGAGRSPVPPGSWPKPEEDDEPTEIIRPPASGS